MEIVSSLFSSTFFLIFLFIVGVGVAISIISSMLKKSGEVAVEGTKSLSKSIFYVIKFIVVTIKEILQILFLYLALILAYVFRRN